TYRDSLRKTLTGEYLDLVEEARKVGRHQWAQTRLANFPQQDLDAGRLVRLRSLQTAYESINKNLGLAKSFLESLPLVVGDSTQRYLFAEAAAAILAELNPDTINRLEAFISFAQLAEREKQQSRTPANTPEQLVALAVSGWLPGHNAPEA